jgi:hypothetical protein
MRLIIATAACFAVALGLGISPVWAAATQGHAAAGKADAPLSPFGRCRPVPRMANKPPACTARVLRGSNCARRCRTARRPITTSFPVARASRRRRLCRPRSEIVRMPRKCPTPRLMRLPARSPAQATGSRSSFRMPTTSATRSSTRRMAAAGNSAAPARSDPQQAALVRERGPEAIRQSRPGSASAWLRTPGPGQLLTRSMPNICGSKTGGVTLSRWR